MDFKFSEAELVSFLHLAQEMMYADGRVTSSEQIALGLEITRLGIKDDELERLIDYSQRLNSPDALMTIFQLDPEKKKYVMAFLIWLMCADEDIDEAELKLLKYIAMICKLPQLGMREAIDYMNNLEF